MRRFQVCQTPETDKKRTAEPSWMVSDLMDTEKPATQKMNRQTDGVREEKNTFRLN